MATEFVITAENNAQILKDVGFKDGATTYSIDFSPWAEKNHDVNTVTWTVKSGSATVSSAALTSNVATGLVTFVAAGRSLIQIKAASSVETYVAHLDLLVKDPRAAIGDYGLVT